MCDKPSPPYLPSPGGAVAGGDLAQGVLAGGGDRARQGKPGVCARHP